VLNPSPVIAEVPADTKERLLDVAERLFAEEGFESVSLRTITAQAGANLAAVNYHFGSKEALIGAVVGRQVEPINRLRLELLEKATDARSIVVAFLDPVMQEAGRSGLDDNRFCKLMSRCTATQDGKISEMIMGHFHEVVAKFVSAISAACPGLSSEVVHLRLLFTAGTMAHSLFYHDKIGMVSEGRCKVPDLDSLRDEMVTFLTAGLESGAQIQSASPDVV
jgi:AcrR family transcriptional regulator